MANDKVKIELKELDEISKNLERLGRNMKREERALLMGIFGLGAERIKEKIGKNAVEFVNVDFGDMKEIPNFSQAFDNAFNIGELSKLPGDTVERVSVGVGISVSGGGPGVGISVSTPI